MKLWMLQMEQAQQLKNVKILIEWQKQIKHLLIIGGKEL